MIPFWVWTQMASVAHSKYAPQDWGRGYYSNQWMYMENFPVQRTRPTQGHHLLFCVLRDKRELGSAVEPSSVSLHLHPTSFTKSTELSTHLPAQGLRWAEVSVMPHWVLKTFHNPDRDQEDQGRKWGISTAQVFKCLVPGECVSAGPVVGPPRPTASQSRRPSRGQQVLNAALLRDQGASAEASTMTMWAATCWRSRSNWDLLWFRQQ